MVITFEATQSLLFFHQFFCEHILKIVTSVPGHFSWKPYSIWAGAAFANILYLDDGGDDDDDDSLMMSKWIRRPIC
jgi:hypothetical protein